MDVIRLDGNTLRADDRLPGLLADEVHAFLQYDLLVILTGRDDHRVPRFRVLEGGHDISINTPDARLANGAEVEFLSLGRDAPNRLDPKNGNRAAGEQSDE